MKLIKSIEEVHIILLDITKAFSEICEKHNIPYTMIGGTMLGAIRHKGFIPWDDDMDFGIPRKYYSQAIELFKKELPEHYHCLTYKDCDQIKYPFFKIEDGRTVIDDPRLNCHIEEKLGLNIDVFPLDTCKRYGLKTNLVLLLVKVQTVLFVESTSSSKFNWLFRRLLRLCLPIKRERILRLIDKLLGCEKKGNTVGNVLGRWKRKEFFPYEVYFPTEMYPFEAIQLRGVNSYKTYLSQLYGDYMIFPPENERICHVNNIFFR